MRRRGLSCMQDRTIRLRVARQGNLETPDKNFDVLVARCFLSRCVGTDLRGPADLRVAMAPCPRKLGAMQGFCRSRPSGLVGEKSGVYPRYRIAGIHSWDPPTCTTIPPRSHRRGRRRHVGESRRY